MSLERWQANVRGIEGRGVRKFIRESKLPFASHVQSDAKGNVFIRNIPTMVSTMYSFSIDVLPVRPRPGVFGMVMFAQSFKLKKWDAADSVYKPIESEYPETYFSSEGTERGKVVIKIVVNGERYYNTTRISSVNYHFLKEAYIQEKLFNEVYGPKGSRKDIPLSPAIPNIHFGLLARTLPQYVEDKPKFFHENLFNTLADYFYGIKGNMYKPKPPKDIIKDDFMIWFSEHYTGGIQNSYRMSMMSIEYAGKTLVETFNRESYGITRTNNPPMDEMKNVLMPVLFQMIHLRVLMNKLGYIHADLKGDNVLAISLAEASKHSLYHTKTIGGDIKEPLFVIDIPHTSFTSSLWNGDSNRIVVNPLKNFSTNLGGKFAMLIKLIDYGLSEDYKHRFKLELTKHGDEPSSPTLSNQSDIVYAALYRPPETYRGKRFVQLYHLSETYALGIVLTELVLGEYITTIASRTSLFGDWRRSYRDTEKLPTPWPTRRENDRGYLLLHYYIRYLLFVCLDELHIQGKLNDPDRYTLLKKANGFDDKTGKFTDKYFMIGKKNMTEFIDWDYGGVITTEQHKHYLDMNPKQKRTQMYTLTASTKTTEKEFDALVRDRWLIATKAKVRIKGILGEYGIYMILKMIYSNIKKRPWAKEVLVEQLGENGLFRDMVVSEEMYYERLRMNGTVDGVNTYNLGLYKLSLDIARPYSQTKIPTEEVLEMHINESVLSIDALSDLPQDEKRVVKARLVDGIVGGIVGPRRKLMVGIEVLDDGSIKITKPYKDRDGKVKIKTCTLPADDFKVIDALRRLGSIYKLPLEEPRRSQDIYGFNTGIEVYYDDGTVWKNGAPGGCVHGISSVKASDSDRRVFEMTEEALLCL